MVSLLLFLWRPIACAPKRSCSSPRCPERLRVSKERVGNSREDARKLQTRTTVRVVILKEWSTGLCFRIFPCAVKVQVPGSSQGAEDNSIETAGLARRAGSQGRFPGLTQGAGPANGEKQKKHLRSETYCCKYYTSKL